MNIKETWFSPARSLTVESNSAKPHSLMPTNEPTKSKISTTSHGKILLICYTRHLLVRNADRIFHNILPYRSIRGSTTSWNPSRVMPLSARSPFPKYPTGSDTCESTQARSPSFAKSVGSSSLQGLTINNTRQSTWTRTNDKTTNAYFVKKRTYTNQAWRSTITICMRMSIKNTSEPTEFTEMPRLAKTRIRAKICRLSKKWCLK